jgi:hypothetical protein
MRGDVEAETAVRIRFEGIPSAGITQFRFNGYDLSLIGTPTA